MPFLRKLRASFAALADHYAELPIRLTLAGAGYLAVLAFVLAATLNSGSNLLYFTFGIMTGVLVAALLVPGICLRKLRIERTVADHGVAGEPAAIEYRITNRRRLWPCFAVRFQERSAALAAAPQGFILYIPPHGSVTLSASLIARQRGVIRLSELRATCSFPFGFFSRAKRLRIPYEFVVYPRIGMLNRQLAIRYRESIETGTMTSGVRGGSDEFYGVREFRPGDNVRAIHWRSTARTRTLMIREMAANAPPQMVVVLNLRAARRTGDRPDAPEAVERAIELAAALLCYGFFENFAVGLAIAGVDGEIAPAPQMGRQARAHLLRRLAVLDPTAVKSDSAIIFPNRLAGRAEWIIVTLHASDPCRDLVAPGSGTSRSGGSPGGGGGGGHHTILPVDAPDADSWIHFLTGKDMQRLLRDPVPLDLPRGPATGPDKTTP